MTVIESPSSTGETTGAAFRQETMDVVTRLRSSLIDAISVPAGGIQKSRDVQKNYGVDFKLSWQVYRICASADPLQLCPHIPTSGAMRKLLTAAKKRGVSETLLQHAETAYVDFEKHVERHAADRDNFDAMMARMLGGETDAQVELVHRRAMFDGQRYLWGTEIEVFIGADVVYPSALGADQIDEAHLRMKRNLQRLSSDAALPVDKRRFTSTTDQSFTLEPIDAASHARYGIPILPPFCSTLDLSLRARVADDGSQITEWMSDLVGKTSAVDMAFGEVVRGLERPQGLQKGKPLFTYGVTFASTPTRTYIKDFMIHRSMFGRLRHEVTRWGHAVEFPKKFEPLSAMRLPQLPSRDPITYLGVGSSAAHTNEVPRYVEMLRSTFGMLGWNLEEMDVYRLRIEYPVMDTLLMINAHRIGE